MVRLRESRRARIRPVVLSTICTAGAILLVLITASVLVLPSSIVERDLQNEAARLEPKDLAKAKNDVRATLLQAIGGLLILTSAGIGAAVSLRQIALGREGQITDRFTHAVDQLGSDTLDVRIGGMYALERIARDSLSDHIAITAVLCSYVQVHAPWPPSQEYQYPVETPIADVGWLTKSAPDVHTAMNILARSPLADAQVRASRGDYPAVGQISLEDVDLRRAVLRGTRMDGAFLRGAHLEGAYLRDAYLRGANLWEAHLEDAFLLDAHLEGAFLAQAHLERANLREARLENADLSGAHLGGATLSSHLEGAKADTHTDWPDTFSREAALAAGVIFSEGSYEGD